MSITRRICFWLIFLVFIGLVFGWILWTPYDPTSLYRAIPANAVLVSSHDNLAERWEGLSTNILLRSVVSGITATLEDPLPGHVSRKTRALIIHIGSRKTVFAYVPSLGRSKEPAWIIASWVGTASQYFRLSLFWKRVPEVNQIGNYGSRSMWGLNQPLTESGMKLSFAFGEGLFLGCISRDPAGIYQVLRAYDRLAPSVFSTKLFDNTPEPGAPDRGWFRWPGAVAKTSAPVFISYRIPLLTSSGLSGDINIHSNIAACTPLSKNIDLAVPGQLLSDLPAIMMILPFDMTKNLLSDPSLPGWADIACNLLKSDTLLHNANCLVLSVLTGDYSGGFGRKPLRVKIPGVLAMIKMKQSDPVAPLILRTLDTLNAQYQMGLIVDPHPFSAGDNPVFTIERTLGDPLLTPSVEDRPAYTLFQDWLIFSSNAGSLVKLLKRVQDPDADIVKGEWQKELESKRAGGLLWMDLSSGGKALRLALSIYSLKARVTQTSHTLSPLPA